MAAAGPGPRCACLQTPGGPHVVFNGGWLARDQMPTVLPGDSSRQLRQQGSWFRIPPPPSRPGLQSLPLGDPATEGGSKTPGLRVQALRSWTWTDSWFCALPAK